VITKHIICFNNCLWVLICISDCGVIKPTKINLYVVEGFQFCTKMEELAVLESLAAPFSTISAVMTTEIGASLQEHVLKAPSCSPTVDGLQRVCVFCQFVKDQLSNLCAEVVRLEDATSFVRKSSKPYGLVNQNVDNLEKYSI
jgi:hypothetical protein